MNQYLHRSRVLQPTRFLIYLLNPCVICCLSLDAQANDQMRDWTFASGEKQSAEIISYDESRKLATLRLPNKSEIKVGEQDLSTIDRAWVLQWVEQDEELRSLRGAADTRNELEERLHKSNLQLTITQTELMSLKEDYGKIKKRFPDEQNKENHPVCSGKFVVDIDGRIHNESAMIVLDMARLEEENLRLKTELAERQLNIKSFLAEESQTVNVVDEWKVSLRWEFTNVHQPDCDRRKVKEGRMRCREFGIHWKFELEVPSDLLQKLGRGRASLPDSNAVVVDQWMFQEMDRRHLVWPFGEKQLRWLVTSLSNLSKKALKKIKAIDKLWMEE